MNALNETLRAIKTIIIAKSIKGTSFIGIREYINQQGEMSNQTLLVGYNYINVLEMDKHRLCSADITPVIQKYGEAVANEALDELLDSLTKRTADEKEKEALRKIGDATIKASDAQLNAYTTVAKGVRLHNDGTLHVTGIMVKKTVLIKGEYKTVNSRPKTLAKNEINKIAGTQNSYVKTFIFKNAEEVKMQGITI